MIDKGPQVDPELVQAIVLHAHSSLDKVRELVAQEPALVNASWDWGGGDWEAPLGSASHMGEREIALFLLDHGARVDIFAAAMLGWVDVVRAVLAERPELRDAKGPHGIPLIAHAEKGGEHAREVVALLERAAAPA